MKKLLILLVLMFFVGVSSSQCEDVSGIAQVWCLEWQQISFIVLLTTYFIVGLMYLLAISVNSERLKAWSRSEFFQICATAIILANFIVMDALVNQYIFPAFATQSLTSPGTPINRGAGDWTGIQGYALNYIEKVKGTSLCFYQELLITNLYGGYIENIAIFFKPEGQVGLNIAPGIFLKPFVDTLGYVLYILTLVIVHLQLHAIILKFAMSNMLPVVLPFGIALRAFSFTRSAGGALIAIAVGFYFVFPIMYLISDEIVYTGPNAYCRAGINCGCGATFIKLMFGAGKDLVLSMLRGGDEVADTLSELLKANGPLAPIMYITGVAATFLPFVNIIVTLTFIRTFASFLGSDIDFSALVKVI